MEFPALPVIEHNFETAAHADAERSVAKELERTNRLGPIEAGQRVIITPGSRGADSKAAVLRSLTGDLSEKTGGNAIGAGPADFIHRRVLEKMDPEITALNSITAVAPEKGMVPIALPSDRKALEAALQSIGPWCTESVRMAWIINTAELKRLAVSPALAREAARNGLSVSGRPFELPFDGCGDLPALRQILATG